ncbi:unnamed protein product [Symbiodinium natans]|uniref:Uncharacterized protein n=1 Tax=Symbiodinium natans TaxID=878477 RepID=A0A812V070_9DINO|nr:unnamed protein product [Symbiodinium natans]
MLAPAATLCLVASSSPWAEVNEDLQVVDELQYFSQPDISMYVGIIALLALILVIGFVVRLMQILNITCDCAALQASQEDKGAANLYNPDDPAADWGQVVQEAAQEEAARRRQANCRTWIKERVASLQEKWQRVMNCIRKKKPESPQAGGGEARVRRVNSKNQAARGVIRSSSLRSSSKLSRGSRRSPSKGSAKESRLESKSSHGAESERSEQAREEPPEEAAPKPPEVPRPSVTFSKEVANEVPDEERWRAAASLPPGFIWHGDHDPELADSLEKYLKWEAVGKELEDVEERDFHPGFHAGNLHGMARLAQQQRQSVLIPIVEPVSKHSAKAHSYSANTLYYSCSTLRESRRKKRKRGASKHGAGAKPTARSLGSPQPWSWTGQEPSKPFRLPIDGPRFSTMKVPGVQSQEHILSLE